MKRNRVGSVWIDNDRAGGFTIEPSRRTALLTIEEVLGEGVGRLPQEATASEVPEAVPTAVPTRPESRTPRRRARRRRRPIRRSRRRAAIVALALGLALCVGAVFGSGAFNSADRYNAELVAAQQGAVEVYGLPEVQGHPGAEPARERSTSIREFLGMASVF
ncbi:MAG: hypothetical protein JSV86_14415 [Gemmatimonadota bacterium]|nr:MAG: hypothetical protein JSV86_14415 [Gemmatimonadota bacterium]